MRVNIHTKIKFLGSGDLLDLKLVTNLDLGRHRQITLEAPETGICTDYRITNRVKEGGSHVYYLIKVV